MSLKFLVTNDDGIFAKGVLSLVQALQPFGEITIVCPDQERSAISHSITLNTPLKANKVNFFHTSLQAWAVNGTPSDCVKMALEVIMNDKPNFVFSGINAGPNLGRDVFYSGTISASIEAALYEIPSMAVSLATLKKDADYSLIEPLAYDVFETLLQHKYAADTVLNINLPYLTKEMVRGVKVSALDMSVHRYRYVGLNDPQGYLCYWLKDTLLEVNTQGSENDFDQIRNGYVTITPLQLSMTNMVMKNKMEKWFKSKETKQI